MSLSVPYENIHDAQMRLQNTVVLYDGEPVWITEVAERGDGDPKDDIFRVYAHPIPMKAREPKAQMRKFISSKKFDMAPFPMGFLNKDGQVYYCTRLPRRQQRQGLSNGTFSCTLVPAQLQIAIPRLEQLVVAPEFYACIKGLYPEYDEAVKEIERGNASSVAFHRQFALVSDPELEELLYLYHKKDKVGFMMDGKIKLTHKGRCLKEALQEIKVPC